MMRRRQKANVSWKEGSQDEMKSFQTQITPQKNILANARIFRSKSADVGQPIVNEREVQNQEERRHTEAVLAGLQR